MLFRSKEAWREQEGKLRKRFDTLLGEMPQVGAPPGMRVVREENIEGVIRRRVVFEVEPGVSMDAYLLIPHSKQGEESSKRPGMIALHPTTANNIDEIAGVGYEGARATGLEFAKLGYVVVCPKCFLWQDAENFQKAVEGHRDRHPNARGIAKMVFDARRAVDALLAIPQVDPNRLVAVGHSLGAKEVLYLMAADSRIVAGVASEGGVDLGSTNWEALWYLGPVPRLDPEWGHDELVALIAPRALLVMGGEQGPGAADGTQSLKNLRRSYPAWRSQGVPQEGSLKGAANQPSGLKKSGLWLWNHRSGHVFGPAQFETASQWLHEVLQ